MRLSGASSFTFEPVTSAKTQLTANVPKDGLTISNCVWHDP